MIEAEASAVDLRDLRALCLVVDLGSITSAAKLLWPGRRSCAAARACTGAATTGPSAPAPIADDSVTERVSTSHETAMLVNLADDRSDHALSAAVRMR